MNTTTDITQSAKRIAIAEHFGWKFGVAGPFGLECLDPNGKRVDYWYANGRSDGQMREDHRHCVPDYFGDLRCTHEAENALSDELHQDFYDALWTLIRVDHAFVGTSKLHRLCCSAPAQLRAEALWLTLCSPEQQPEMKPVSSAGIIEMNKILFQ